jgi:8-hydroxy-5-deazaflavin:NADPH oxidoreductase
VAARPIGIVGGAGAEGFGLALRWAQAGETVIIGSRDATRAQQAADKIKQRVANANVSGTDNSATVAASDLIVLTIPFAAHASTLKELKPAIRPGSIVVDTTVPLAAAVGGRATRTLGVWQGSAAQQAAEILGKEIHVVAAFHHVGSDLLISNGPVDCDVIVCSDDPIATKTIRQLAAKIPGVRALDGGKLENARILEQITALLIGFSIRDKGHAGIRITGLPGAAYRV